MGYDGVTLGSSYRIWVKKVEFWEISYKIFGVEVGEMGKNWEENGILWGGVGEILQDLGRNWGKRGEIGIRWGHLGVIL